MQPEQGYFSVFTRNTLRGRLSGLVSPLPYPLSPYLAPWPPVPSSAPARSPPVRRKNSAWNLQLGKKPRKKRSRVKS